MKIYSILLIFILSSSHISAQENDLSPAGVMISHAHSKGGWMFSYTYMNMYMKGNLQGQDAITDDKIYNSYIMSGNTMKMQMHMLMAMYGVTGRLTLMAMANYQSSDMTMNIFSGAIHTHVHNGSSTMNYMDLTMHTKGLSDTKLTAIYKMLNAEHAVVVGSLGINLPTGDFQMAGNPHAEAPTDHYPYAMQGGSGTIDFSPGITYLHTKNKLTYSGQAIATIRPFDNALNYHLGNEYMGNVWAAYKALKFASASVRLEGVVSDEISGYDQYLEFMHEPSSSASNYGGSRIQSYFGLNFYPGKGVLKNSKFGLEFGMPIYNNVNGIQMKLRNTLFASYTISI